MILILTQPMKIGRKTWPKGKEVDFEANTAKRLIQEKKARKPGILNKLKRKK